MSIRERVGVFIDHPKVQTFIVTLIVVNAITLGMETSPAIMEGRAHLFHAFDAFVLTVFVAEIAAKLFARGLRFFRDGWNVFDLLIVGIALLPASGPLAVLRALRILRVLRLMSVVPAMRNVIQALITAIPGMVSIVGLIALIFYVASVLATNFFGAGFQEWFGNVGASMYSLFQIMTLESWSRGIVRPVMEVYSWGWIVFVAFIVLSSFTVLNLFIAIIIDSMQTLHETEQTQTIEEMSEVVHEEHQHRSEEFLELQREIQALKTLLEERGPKAD